MDWKILSIGAEGDLITEAKYFVTAEQGGFKVETEGNWYFKSPELVIPMSQVTEAMVVQWIKDQTMQDGNNIIEARLQEQLAALQKQRKTPLPWMPQVFTPEI